MFEEKGYNVNVKYANNSDEIQAQQIKNMVVSGCDLIIICSIDGVALGDVIKEASEKGVKIISYDRLIMESEYIDYYISFDNYMVGTLQGQYIIDKLGLDKNKGPFNLEVISGSPDDNNATLFYNGAMEKLKPYIDKGVLNVKSGQTDFQSASTQSWDSNLAEKRLLGKR